MAGLRLVHTADVHLGYSSQAFGPAAPEHRRRVQQAFERCLAVGRERGARLLVIAGDLFDSDRPPERVAQWASAALRNLATGSSPVVTVLAPGTHDPVVPGSVYRRWLDEGLPPGVHLLYEEQPAVQLPDLHTTVTFTTDIRELRPDPAARFNLGLLHGSEHRPGQIEADHVMFTREQIAATGVDYLAVGHWHGFGDYSQGKVVALYPGSPEILALDQTDYGHALLAELSADASPRWERVLTGSLRCSRRELDVADLRSSEELIQELLQLADPDTILDARLTGLAAPDLVLDLDEILERVASYFFRLRLVDESHLSWDGTAPEPTGLVSARFRELMRARYESAGSDEERHQIEAAQRLGLALLGGKEVLE